MYERTITYLTFPYLVHLDRFQFSTVKHTSSRNTRMYKTSVQIFWFSQGFVCCNEQKVTQICLSREVQLNIRIQHYCTKPTSSCIQSHEEPVQEVLQNHQKLPSHCFSQRIPIFSASTHVYERENLQLMFILNNV